MASYNKILKAVELWLQHNDPFEDQDDPEELAEFVRDVMDTVEHADL